MVPNWLSTARTKGLIESRSGVFGTKEGRSQKIENLKGSRNGRKKLDTKERNEMTSDCRPRDERRCGRLTVRRERDYIRDKVGLDCLPLKRSGEVLYM